MNLAELDRSDCLQRMGYLEKYLLVQKDWSARVMDILKDNKDKKLSLKRAQAASKPSPVAILRKLNAEFFDCISLPSVKYIGVIHSLEGVLWFVVILLTTMVSATYMAQMYHRWRTAPVIIAFNDSMVHVSHIPMPAVTVCPQRQTNPRKFIYNSTCMSQSFVLLPSSRRRCWIKNPYYYPLDDQLRKCTTPNVTCSEYDWMHLYGASLLCPDSVILPYEHVYDVYDSSMIYFINKLLPISSDDLVDYRFNKGRLRQDSYKEFQTIFVDGDVCYTFNMMPVKEMFKADVAPPGKGVFEYVKDPTIPMKKNWSPDTMFQNPDLSDTIPRHVGRATRRSGLQFIIEPLTEQYVDVCTPWLRNFKIGLHHPAELPTISNLNYIRSLDRLDVHLKVTPQLTTTEEGLREYEPSRRKCYYSDERSLALYSIYTQKNCYSECLVNCSLSVCGCIPYFLPRHNSSIRICHNRRHDKGCSQTVVPGLIDEVYTWKYVVENFRTTLGGAIQNELRGYEIISQVDALEAAEILRATNPNCSCDCPDTCTSLEYDADISYFFSDKISKKTMQFTISFGDSYYPTILRKQLLDFKGFIAECGGILGVFTGFSFIALSEMLYFITLRLWVTVKNS